MSKIVGKYMVFSAQNIKDRAENTGDMVVSGDNVLVTNLTTAKIRNVLGEGSNALSVLCKSDKINKWAAFSPYIKSYDSSLLEMTIVKPTSNYKMGDFACYNHMAKTPVLQSSDVNEGATLNLTACGSAPTTGYIQFDITLGELDYRKAVGNWDLENLSLYVEFRKPTDGGGTLVSQKVWTGDINTQDDYSFSVELDNLIVNANLEIDLTGLSVGKTGTSGITKIYWKNEVLGTEITMPFLGTYAFDIRRGVKSYTTIFDDSNLDTWTDTTSALCIKYIPNENTVEYEYSFYESGGDVYLKVTNIRIFGFEEEEAINGHSLDEENLTLKYKVNDGAYQTYGTLIDIQYADTTENGRVYNHNTTTNPAINLGSSISCSDVISVMIDGLPSAGCSLPE